MNASGRSKIVLPLAAALTVFAFSAHAQGIGGAGEPPHAKGPPPGAHPAGPRPPGVVPGPRVGGPGPGPHVGGPGPGVPVCGGLEFTSEVCPAAPASCTAARSRLGPSEAMPIVAISPGKAAGGIIRFTTAVWAGGGMSAASGTSIRSASTVRPLISPRITPTTSPMMTKVQRRSPAPMRRLQALTRPPPPRSGRSRRGRRHCRRRARRSLDRTRQRRGRGRRDRRSHGRNSAARDGYWLSNGGCYYRYPSGAYVVADPRWCY